MLLKKLIVAQMLFASLSGPVLAQAPSEDPKALVGMQYRICDSVCAKRFRHCGTGSECDTSYVGCTIGCHGCVP